MSGTLQQVLFPVAVLAAAVSLPSAAELLLVTSGAMRRRSKIEPRDAEHFGLAVIVPAHNEADLIGRCVANLLDASVDFKNCSVVVVADNCSDTTAALAQMAGARILVRDNVAQRGKGYALRFAFDTLMKEGFDGFLIIDADSVVSSGLIADVIHGLVNGSDALQARYRVAAPSETRRKQLMDVALLAFNVLRPRGRFGWGLSAGILGNGFALSRQTLLDVPYSAESIVEDLEYHLLLVSAGKSVQFIDTATVYGDMPDDEAAQASQRARWEGGRARVASSWVPKLGLLLMRGKWKVFEPLLELLTLPLAYLTPISLLLCLLPFAGFRIYGLLLFGLLVTHIVAAISLGGNVLDCYIALASAPAYVFWKLGKIGSILRSSRAKTQWLRTARANEAKREGPDVG
jgi:cellulose synthase/poly-beta-1,6-N-acetylglucosamine synthase-like glycosyltransferase